MITRLFSRPKVKNKKRDLKLQTFGENLLILTCLMQRHFVIIIYQFQMGQKWLKVLKNVITVFKNLIYPLAKSNLF